MGKNTAIECGPIVFHVNVGETDCSVIQCVAIWYGLDIIWVTYHDYSQLVSYIKLLQKRTSMWIKFASGFSNNYISAIKYISDMHAFWLVKNMFWSHASIF